MYRLILLFILSFLSQGFVANSKYNLQTQDSLIATVYGERTIHTRWFGQNRTTSRYDNSVAFTGRYHDKETGLYNAISNPGQTFSAIAKHIKCKSETAEGIGELIGDLALGAASGGILAKVAKAAKLGKKIGKLKNKIFGGKAPKKNTVKVTSWAGGGKTPDLNSGRWVVKGDATKWNYFKTGLGGPKLDFTRKFPFFKVTKSKVPFKNSVTGEVPKSSFETPKGFGLDGWIKALFGQKKIKK